MSTATRTTDRTAQHFLKLCLETCLGRIKTLKHVSKIEDFSTEVDSKANESNGKTWNIGDYMTIYVKYKCSGIENNLAAKIVCKNTYSSNERVLDELFLRGTVMQALVSEIEPLGHKISPTVFTYSSTFRTLFEEDVSKEGYLPKSAGEGLSFLESFKVIKLMAQLHASSVFLYEKEPDMAELFQIRDILRDCDHLTAAYSKSMKKAIRYMNKMYPIIATRMDMFKDITIQHITDFYDYDSEEFCVLNHGDFCVNNLLFANDAAIPLLINYQMTVYSSPAIDLLHFLNTSGNIAAIYDQDELLLEHYLNTLRGTMKSLNCRTAPPTMEQLKAAMQKRILYGAFAGITFKLNTMIVKDDEKISSDHMEFAMKMLLVMYHRNYFDCKKLPQSLE